MSAKYLIKSPDGRIVQAPQGVLVADIDRPGSYLINPKALKPGWSIATDADIKPVPAKAAKPAEKVS